MDKFLKIVAVVNQVLDFLKHVFTFNWTKDEKK